MNMSQQFLVSLPMLGDSNFFKSVVCVENHDGDGAKGWIVNKELDARVAVRLRKSIQLGINAPIYYGGPVEVNQCFVLHSSDIMLAQSLKINDNLCVTRDKSIITMLNENKFPQNYRIIIGCASWGPVNLKVNYWAVEPAVKVCGSMLTIKKILCGVQQQKNSGHMVLKTAPSKKQQTI